ncbi:DIS3-like exonuclease 2 isoform X2 [Cryptomeria japonica]|uniref:DIS3-like exonuclease 2 isoform X2 n=1 Tax=Cryptomeria japonica TaxID=3369 RepID=UPI0027DA5FBC|nr:DIS3-like exonuclease 2 isoform X2 [Cryptomeria japonica]
MGKERMKSGIYPGGCRIMACEKGEAFQAVFRVNMHNRLEGYCTLEGVSTDVLISGLGAQNRAVEGDIVAIVTDPVSSWPKLKGAQSKQQIRNSDTKDDNIITAENEGPSKAQCMVEQMYNNNCNGQASNMNLMGDCLNSLDLEDNGLSVDKAINIFFCNDNSCHIGEQCLTNCDSSEIGSGDEHRHEMAKAKANVAMIVNSLPGRRPTGRVIGIIEKSPRRDAVIGFLEVKQWIAYKDGQKWSCSRNGQYSQKNVKGLPSHTEEGYIKLVPTDTRFPKMTVQLSSLPDNLKKRLHKGDLTLESELVAASIDLWRADCFLPQAVVKHSLGQSGEIEAQTAAILFEHAIHSANFPPDSLSCLPKVPWKIPTQEFQVRRDLRNLCIFSIDPPNSRDIDDALSIEDMGNGIKRVGVHIADVSYFVHPDTMLDREAQGRSTSVYLIQCCFPMLPQLLREELCSLNPGVDRLAFSVMWDIDSSGEVLDHWVGRTVIRSCCKLLYQHAQDIIEGTFQCHQTTRNVTGIPEVHCEFGWQDIIANMQNLHRIAKQRRKSRFGKGALRLDNCKLVFVLDEDGKPCDSMFNEQKDSNILVEEFMLLANMTVAKIICRAFPECSLLRKHPEPNLRKLKDLEAFCKKLGFDLDVSSAGALHLSLEKLRNNLKDDPELFNIIVLYATKPMQLATYFCTGELREKETEWAHYALATPLYTHFTSPIRRYADIVVHRILAATLEAEYLYQKQFKDTLNLVKKNNMTLLDRRAQARCFTGPVFDKEAMESPSGRKALMTASLKHKVPRAAELALVAAHCNERKLASKNVQEASVRLYLWALLKKQKLISDARVLALGPKFISVYIYKLAAEHRIYFDETEGLNAEWLESTRTLVLDMSLQKSSDKMNNKGKNRTFEDIALVVNPASPVNSSQEHEIYEDVLLEIEKGSKGDLLSVAKVDFDKINPSKYKNTEPAVLPLTLRLLSTIPVSIHAIGGDNSPPDISVRFFLSSYIS